MRQLSGVLLILALLSTLLAAWAFPRMNEDIFLALCLGREVANGTFTDPNSWSFVLPAQVFVDRAWLSNFLYYLTYVRLGSLGPLSIKAILLACYAGILYYRCRKLEVSKEISLLALTLGMFALAPFLTLRGENFGILCFLALTTFLTASPRWGRNRQVGAVIVMAIWSNCHGTWPLGVILIAFRLIIDLLYTLGILEFPWAERHFDTAGQTPTRQYQWFNSNRKHGLPAGPDAGGWLVALVLLFPVLIAANPYSLKNFSVFSYVWGTDKYEKIAEWVDNLPLIHPSATLLPDFYDANSVLPFLGLLVTFACLGLCLRIMAGRVEGFSFCGKKPVESDLLMEAAILLVLIPMTFKWRRLIVFAAPGLVPILAVLIQANWEVFKQYSARLNEFARDRRFSLMCVAGALAVFGIAAGTTFGSAVKPYFSNNPTYVLRENRPLIQRLLSHNLVWTDVLGFLKENGVQGRIMASLQLADYLLLNLKDIQIFLDLRAQAAYSPQNFADFFSIMITTPGQAGRAIELLDRYQVDFVVLDFMEARKAAAALMETRKWGCIYMDRWVIALARADSGPFASAVKSANLDRLWFGDYHTRILSQATLSFFMKGEIESELLNQLKSTVRNYPDPEVYSLLVMAMTGQKGRLTDPVKAYLSEELDRLSNMDYMVPGGVRNILESQARILSILYMEESAAGQMANANRIAYRQAQVLGLMKDLCDKYSVSMKLQ